MSPPYFALTGTPGVGKSSVAQKLADGFTVVEVDALARAARACTRVKGGTVVDLVRMRRWMRGHRPQGIVVVVGHLAHLLPVDRIVVLRCHPMELERRLRRSRRGTARDRHENVAAEAIDLVLAEARSTHRPVWEIDTTGRAPLAVTREVGRALRNSRRGGRRSVDWLRDPAVTEWLLRWDRYPG